MTVNERNYAKLGKLDVAEQLVLWLNERDLKMTYGEFGRVAGHPARCVGDLLGDINRRHKARGGNGMITNCITDRFGNIGDGYDLCKKELELT